MDRPSIFIGSSSEALDVAYSLQAALEYEADPTVWNQGIFRPTSGTLADLVEEARTTDFAAFIFAPDDIVEVRGERSHVVRDNVLFELGLFIGALGVDRCFLIVPRNSAPLRLPTDLLGINTLSYAADRTDGRLRAALGPASHTILETIRKEGATASSRRAPEPVAPTPVVDAEALTALFLAQWDGPSVIGARNRLRAGAPMHVYEDEDGQATRDVETLFNFFNGMADAVLAGRADEHRLKAALAPALNSLWAHAFTYLAPLNLPDEWWDPLPKIAELSQRWRRDTP